MKRRGKNKYKMPDEEMEKWVKSFIMDIPFTQIPNFIIDKFPELCMRAYIARKENDHNGQDKLLGKSDTNVSDTE